MSKKYTYRDPMPPTEFIERHLLGLLIAEMRAAGWEPDSMQSDSTIGETRFIFDKHATHDAIVQKIWRTFCSKTAGSTRGARLHFKSQYAGGLNAWVLLIDGNGDGFISDYTAAPTVRRAVEKVYLG